MPYDYATQREEIFTDRGQQIFLTIRDETFRLLKLSGVVRLDKLLELSIDPWMTLACLDRMVELKELREIPQDAPMAQYRIFTRAKGEN